MSNPPPSNLPGASGGPLPEEAFRALCLQYHAGEIDEAGFDAMCAALDGSAERRAVFVELAIQAEAVIEAFEHDEAEQTAAELGIADDDEFSVMDMVVDQALAARRRHELEDEAGRRLAAQQAEEARLHRMRIRRTSEPDTRRVIVIPAPLIWMGIAAVLLLAGTFIYQASRPGPASPPPTADRSSPQPRRNAAPVLASHVSSVDARWADGADASAVLRRGSYRLLEGLAEIELIEGTRIVLEGPVSFRLTGTNEIELDRGRLVAHVPPSGYGFTVDTPTARIVDYGTEFGVFADDDRQTQVQVFRGEVRAASVVEGHVVGASTPIVEQQAAAIGAGGASIVRVAFDEGTFERRVAKRLDLADMIVGGDGTTGRRGIGIHPLTGALAEGIGSAPNAMIMLGAGEARPVPGSPFTARVFIPSTDGPVAGLPAGLELPGLPATNGVGFGLLWCGEQLPTPTPDPLTPVTNDIPGYDLDGPGHQSLIMHANLGLVIDLEAVRRANPGMRVSAVSAVVGSTAGQNPVAGGAALRSEFLVFLDNDLAAHERFSSADPPGRHSVELEIEVADGQRYLTLVSADAGDENHRDWLVVGDPIVVLEPIP